MRLVVDQKILSVGVHKSTKIVDYSIAHYVFISVSVILGISSPLGGSYKIYNPYYC